MNQSVVFSLSDPNTVLPGIVYIDTNTIAEVAFKRTHQSKVSNSLVRLVENDTFLGVSQHMWDELMNTTHVEVLKQEMANDPSFVPDPKLRNRGVPDYKQFENTGVNVGPLVIQRYNDIVAMFRGLAPDAIIEFDMPSPLELRLRTNALVQYGVPPKDAQHVAIMHFNGTNDIFTLDEGFHRSPNLNIYAVNYKLLQHATPNAVPVDFNPVIP